MKRLPVIGADETKAKVHSLYLNLPSTLTEKLAAEKKRIHARSQTQVIQLILELYFSEDE